MNPLQPTVNYTIKEFNRPDSTHTGTLIEKILVAEKYSVDMPSGRGGVVTCEQYVSVHKFMVINHESGRINFVDPHNIKSIITANEQPSTTN